MSIVYHLTLFCSSTQTAHIYSCVPTKIKAEVADVLNQKKAIRLLERLGWVKTRGGKHAVKMEKQGRRPITLPRHKGKDYGKGLSHAILKQARFK